MKKSLLLYYAFRMLKLIVGLNSSFNVFVDSILSKWKKKNVFLIPPLEKQYGDYDFTLGRIANSVGKIMQI